MSQLPRTNHVHRQRARYRVLLLSIALLIGTLLSTQVSALAQGGAHLRIVRTDLSHLPSIEATIQLDAPQGEQTQPDITVSLEGASVAEVERRPTQVPGAVMLVADLSSRMSEPVAHTTRFQLMQPMVSDLVSQLQSGDQRAGLIVITQTVTIAHKLTNDLGAIANTLTQSNPQLQFIPQSATDESSAGAYPLDDAIKQALDQLDQAAPEQPRTLVVFAVGDATKEFNTGGIHTALATAVAKGHPVELLVYGFASDPATLTKLQLADVGTVTPVIVDGKLPSPDLKRQIFVQYAGVLRRSTMTTLRFSATKLSSGPMRLIVSAGNISDSVSLQIPPLSPVVSIVTSSSTFQGAIQMATRVDFQQAAITQVEYLLNDLPIAAPVTEGPNFRYMLNTNDLGFQQKFRPGSYELVVAVTDANNQHSRSQPQRVEVVAVVAPQGGNGTNLALLIGAGAGVVVVAAVVAWLWWRSRQQQPLPGLSPAVDEDVTVHAPFPDEKPTAPYSPEDVTAPVAVPDKDITVPFDPRRTVILDPEARKRHRRWYVEVVSGDPSQRIELKQSQRNYDIGRAADKRTPDISLQNSYVSRDHARIELLDTGPTLIAGDSSQGTFFGPEKVAMAQGDRRLLVSGDVFWLSPEVKLHIFSEPMP